MQHHKKRRTHNRTLHTTPTHKTKIPRHNKKRPNQHPTNRDRERLHIVINLHQRDQIQTIIIHPEPQEQRQHNEPALL